MGSRVREISISLLSFAINFEIQRFYDLSTRGAKSETSSFRQINDRKHP